MDFLADIEAPVAGHARHSISEVTTLLQCSQRWYYKYKVGLPDPAGPAARWGIDFHAAVEARYKGEPLPEMAPDIAEAFSAFDQEIASRVRPLAPEWVERWVEYTIGGVPFHGRIDLVDDQLTVRDVKTKSRRPSQQDADDSLQLTAYHEAVRQTAGETPKAVVWDVLVRNRKPVAESYISERKPRDVARLERIVLTGFEAVDKGYIVPNWGGLFCSNCPFRERCIEDTEGGTGPMTQGTYADELGDYDNSFAGAPEPGQPLPEGIYLAMVQDAYIVRGVKDPSALFLKVEFTVVEGDETGNDASIFQGLTDTDARKMGFTKRALRALGYEEPGLRGLEEWLSNLPGRVYQIQVKTNGQYTNTYVNRRVERPTADGYDTPAPGDEDAPGF